LTERSREREREREKESDRDRERDSKKRERESHYMEDCSRSGLMRRSSPRSPASMDTKYLRTNNQKREERER
jgi:hypothetical protein